MLVIENIFDLNSFKKAILKSGGAFQGVQILNNSLLQKRVTVYEWKSENSNPVFNQTELKLKAVLRNSDYILLNKIIDEWYKTQSELTFKDVYQFLNSEFISLYKKAAYITLPAN